MDRARDLSDYSCPSCDKMVVIVSDPTVDQMQQAAEEGKLDPAEQAQLTIVAALHERWHRLSLKSADQLPDVDSPRITVTWDHENDDSDLVLRVGERVIWTESCYFECHERFDEIVAFLSRKYGSTLYDVVPTERSWAYLLGDSISASDRIERIRERLRKPQR